MSNSELVGLLAELGLTEYEAKTLSTLFKLREAEAPAISRTAQVPKTRVYDVLERLIKKNLLIEIYGRPKKYRVVEPENVFNELLGVKKSELRALEQKAQKLKELVVAENGSVKSAERIMKVRDRSDFLRILSQEIEKAKNSVVGFGDLADEHAVLGNALKNASKKDVEIKLISKIASSQKLAKDYAANGIELKDFEHGVRAYILDGQKVVLGLSNFNEERPEYHFTIWEDNKTMVSALMMYFNDCWQKGQKVE